jgi:hypothetical protein
VVPKTVQFLFGTNGGDFTLLFSFISVSALSGRQVDPHAVA